MADTPERIVGHRVATIRGRKGMSARQLAERIEELGGKLSRALIAKIETGARPVSLNEVFVLAAALDASPLQLMLPVGDEQPVHITDDLEPPSRDVWFWTLGQNPLPGMDEDFYHRELMPPGVDEALTLAMQAMERALDESKAVRDSDDEAEKLRRNQDAIEAMERYQNLYQRFRGQGFIGTTEEVRTRYQHYFYPEGEDTEDA